ncbi:UNVERIFIED_ORG: GTPase SAR1 family protein [Agrobacterium larrymoorei]|nr:GTPase SAR1 family protein [Agrobacterium larrymoorei]
MNAPFDMTTGMEKLATIIEQFPEGSEHWNEAQNRFQFVDRLLLECLGWEHPNVEVEKTDELGGRSDYRLGKPVRAVLEAKREAKKFDFLPGTKAGQARRLRPLVEGCPNLKAAVNQVIPYCAMAGAQIAIVCNGPQLVVFQASIPTLSPLESECFVFDGLKSYKDKFTLLWKLLSPEGIEENRAYRDLSNIRNPRVPPKASTGLSAPSEFRYRSGFQENLRAISSVLLDNVEDNPEVKSDFYRECYVPLDANSRNLLLSKNIIAARYKRVSDDGIAPAKLSTQLKHGRLHIDDAVAGAGSNQPVVVVGDVGVGKTSFFENLFEELDERQRKLTYYIHINLGTKATLSRDVKSFILTNVPKILKEKYQVNIESNDLVERIYHDELVEFDDSVEGQLKHSDAAAYLKSKIEFLKEKIADKGEHLQAAFKYLSKRENKQIIIVIDNADQRSFEVQQEAFLIGQELASERNVLVFVSLRPSTFYLSKMVGALSGYKNRVLTISPPPADEVIRKRVTFAVRIAEGKVAPAVLVNVRMNIKSIVLFLQATLRSIKSNPRIQMFLSNITGGNTRLVIELFTSFCGSPNVESERIVSIEGQTGDYKVPLHEFTKHALLGEYTHFNPVSSLVGFNLFDVSLPDPREHFLSILVVAFISSPTGKRDHDGFVSAEEILIEMMRLGFLEEQARHAIRRLARKRLIETPHGHYREIQVADDELPDQFYFRATSIGLYHIRNWVGDFAFLDATSIDTPIFDQESRDQLFVTVNSVTIDDRFARASTFKRYLEISWHQADFQQNYYDFISALTLEKDSFLQVERHIRKNNERTHFAKPFHTK